MKELVEKGNNLSNYIKKWRNYLESRKTNLLVSRRFDISAPSTMALAFFGDVALSPCKMFWAIQGIDKDDSKILALWFNSTVNIAQILSRRAETRGAFMGLDQYILQEFLVPNPSRITKEHRDHLLRVFEEHAKTKLPSIIEQLKTKNLVRRAIDLAVLQALEIKGNHEELLDSAYTSVSGAIQTLATLMKEGQVEE